MKILQEVNSDKIVFVLGGLTGGGAERVAVHLINYWAKNGKEVVLISRRGREKDFYSIPGDVKRIELGGEGESGNKMTALLKNIQYVWKLRKAIRSTGSGTVISFMTRTNLHTLFATRGLKRRVIISERNDTTKQHHGWPWHGLREKMYKHADVVTANSEIALDGMRAYVPSSKLALVQNPVEIPFQKAAPAESMSILNVGRLVAAKNQSLILQALDLLGPEYSRWKLIVLGEGELGETLTKEALNRGISDRVEFQGLVKDPQPWYKSSALFVLPSLFEGTPNALLEAMAHGLPCIVSDSLPGALELISDGVSGLVFRSGDAADLAEKMQRLMSDPGLRIEMGETAAKRVQEFAPEKVILKWGMLL